MNSAQQQAGNVNAKPQHVVVPVRTDNRIRIAQFDWVCPIKSAADFKTWVARFRLGARFYLSKDVYPDEEDRRAAWQLALYQAAEAGNFAEMSQLVDLLDADEIHCEYLLTSLEKRFLPCLEAEQKRVMLKFGSFARGKLSLLQAVKDLKVVILDCNRQGYKPDKDTVRLKFESLVPLAELPILRLYEMKASQESPITTSSASSSDPAYKHDIFLRAIEQLAQDQEGQKQDGNRGGLPFAGGAYGNDKRNGKKPKRKGFKGDSGKFSQTCKYCGHGNCAALKGEGKERCPAFEKECKKCGKKGHFQSVCRSNDTKRDSPKSQANAAVSLEGF